MNTFSVAAVFSDHMVLQRNKFISIFGYGDDNQTVNAKLFNEKNELLSENNAVILNGRWDLQLDPQIAQNGCCLQITCNETSKKFSDIAIGEVWIAGGQSNMEFELQNCTEGPEELKLKSNPKIHFYYTNKISWKDEHFYEAEKATAWQTWDSEWKKAWSAVGYFFGKKLSQELDCTVGIIGCNWGGTSASAWMRKEFLEKDDDLRTYLTEQEEATKGKSIEQQCKEYDDYVVENDAWQIKCNELYATVPGITWAQVQERIGVCKWPGPKSCKNPYRPTGLYDCMLSRIMPYTVKGVIWYQGESDDHKPGMYAKLFSTMIDNWRTDWHDDTMPFVYVQLPGNRYEQDKDFKNWPLIREAQAKVHNTVKNAFMTCALDLGQYNDIHPKGKLVIAERMANNALANVYNLKNAKDVLSPLYVSSISKPATSVSKGTITIEFDNAASGFELRDDEETFENYKKLEKIQGNQVPENFTGFEIAGADGVYYPAEFAFGGSDSNRNTIILCNEKVKNPVFARYAWYNYGPVRVYGKNGLPLAPFRTSTNDSKAQTEHAEIQQIMTV